MRLFSNYNEDPEIRIASYLAVMGCPNTALIDAVKDVLKGERINHGNLSLVCDFYAIYSNAFLRKLTF